MAHYALLDENSIVVQVITGRDEDDFNDSVEDWEDWYSQSTGFVAKRTSFNTYREIVRVDEDNWFFGESKHREGQSPFRGQYANIGDYYDSEIDEFVTPKN